MVNNLDATIGYLIFAVVAAGFTFLNYAVPWILAPRKKVRVKADPFECGEAVYGKPWVNIHVRYYIFAMLFLIFDVETVFIFPWAYYYNKLGWFGFIEMFIFIVILLVGLIFPWKKGVLTWDYSTKGLLKKKTS